MRDNSDRYVTLRGGLIVPLEALRLLWDLEDRGFSFTLEDDRIIVRPGSALTADDEAAIRRWRPDVLTLLSYTPPADQAAPAGEARQGGHDARA